MNKLWPNGLKAIANNSRLYAKIIVDINVFKGFVLAMIRKTTGIPI
jgi:hypothetical protein